MGVNRTTLYNYYKSKAMIFEDIIKDMGKLSKIERCKYILRCGRVSNEQYEKIFEIVGA